MVLNPYHTPYVRIVSKDQRFKYLILKKDYTRNQGGILMFWFLNNYRVRNVSSKSRNHEWNDWNIWKFWNIKNSCMVQYFISKKGNFSLCIFLYFKKFYTMWLRSSHFLKEYLNDLKNFPPLGGGE